MATIDQLDISVYNMYAVRTRMIEQINQELRLDQASSIPPQTSVVDIYPKMTELDILLGTVPKSNPWAYFNPPPKMRKLRRSPFAFYRIVPSMGSLKDQEEERENLEEMEVEDEEGENEKKIIAKCFDRVGKINEWLSFIIGRVGQFLQG